MATIKDFFFCKRCKCKTNGGEKTTIKIILAPQEGEKFYVGGKIYGDKNFNNGDNIVTTYITSINDNLVETFTGTRYQLESMCSDYQELLEAEKKFFPIIDNWKLSGNRFEGFTLTGNIVNLGERIVSGIVEKQDGNIVTINGTDYLVIWTNFDSANSFITQFNEKDLEPYMGFGSTRPKLF